MVGKRKFDERWDLLRLPVAGILICAATAKVFNVVEVLAGDSLLSSWPRLIAVVAFEVTATTYILTGNRYWSWWLAALTFSAFASASLYSILTNRSCDCISSQIDSEWMLLLDLVVLALVSASRPKYESFDRSDQLRSVCVGIAIACLFAGAAIWQHERSYRTKSIEFLLAEMYLNEKGPSRFSVGGLEFSITEDRYARERFLPADYWPFIALVRC